jgi:hypothetical protein
VLLAAHPDGLVLAGAGDDRVNIVPWSSVAPVRCWELSPVELERSWALDEARWPADDAGDATRGSSTADETLAELAGRIENDMDPGLAGAALDAWNADTQRAANIARSAQPERGATGVA